MTRPSNAPYEPQFYPTMPEPWRGYLARFLRFCEWVPIDPKEGGVLWHGIAWAILLSSQRYLIEEIFWGLSQGFHDFVIVKGRQLGISTVLWAFDLFWLTRFSLQGMYVADDEPNKEIHRDIIHGDIIHRALTGPCALLSGGRADCGYGRERRASSRDELTWSCRGSERFRRGRG